MSAGLLLINGDKAETPCRPPQRALVADLPPNERLLLWTMRMLGENRGNLAVVQQELWLCCGLASIENVLQALEALLALLTREGRRPLVVKPADARRMNATEESLIALIAAGRDRDSVRLAAHARWLVRPLAQAELRAQALRLGQAFPSGHEA